MIQDPNIEQMLEKTDNRYVLAVQAAKRARQLIKGDAPLYDAKEVNKPLVVAIQEIRRGLITYTKPEVTEE